jgi:hypothetical protein
MTRPVRILVCGGGPSAQVLEAALGMGAPAHFSVTTSTDPRAAPPGGYDLALVAVDPRGHSQALAALREALGGTPFIVVPPWHPGLAELDSWMRQGADDVLGLAELNARRLTAAVIKAVERHARLRAHLPAGTATAAWSSITDGMGESWALGGEAGRFLAFDEGGAAPA